MRCAHLSSSTVRGLKLGEVAMGRPNEEQLARYAAGDCGEEEAQAIEAYLEQSPEAREWVERARANAAWLDSMQKAVGQTEPGADETQQALGATVSAPGDKAAATTSPGYTPQIEGYEIVRELSRGGQGVVYQALQRSTKRKVAIKVLLEGPYASKSARKRFEREIELIAQLRHPNIISIFHSGTTPENRQFYVMDYVRGMPLHRYVREKKLALEDTLKLFGTVSEAVQFAHQKGIIHRDLKPTNILVEADGTPKVMDFGLAKLLAGPVETLVSISQEVLGTLPYMSPEQARGNPDEIDTRTDIYALGVILYELLTGHYPYPVVGQVVEVLRHITDTPPTPPSRSWKPDSGITQRTSKKVRAGQCPIDDEVQTIVLRALSKERERRYQSAGELARDVGHYLAGEPIEAKRDSGWYVIKKTVRRYKVAVSVALLFVTLLVVFGALMSVQAERNRRLADSERGANALATRRSREAEDALQLAEVARAHAEQQADLAQRQLYAIQVAQADNAFRNAEVTRMKRVLEECSSRLRGWEWYWLKRMSDRSERTLRSDGKHVYWCVAFSPKGDWVVFGCSDGTLRFCSPDSAKEFRRLAAHKALISDVAVTPGGDHIISASGDRSIRIWNVSSGSEVRTLSEGESQWTSVAISSNGKYIAAAGLNNNIIKVWDWDMGEDPLALDVAGHGVESLAFRPGSTQLYAVVMDVSYATAHLRRWDAATGETLAPLAIERVGANVAFSPDGQRFVMNGSHTTDLAVLDAETGAVITSLAGNSGWRNAIAYSADGSLIASCADDRTLMLWDATTGESLGTMTGHDDIVIQLAFDPSGQYLLSTSWDKTVKWWATGACREVQTLRHLTSTRFRPSLSRGADLAMSPDGKHIVVWDNDGPDTTLWDAVSGQRLQELPGAYRPVTFNPKGAQFAVTDEYGNPTIWDVAPPERSAQCCGATTDTVVVSHLGQMDSDFFPAMPTDF